MFESLCLKVRPLIPPVSPALQNNSVAVSVPAANKVADKGADNYRIKQVKAVVTEIKKKRKGKPEITLWEVRVGSAISKIYFTPSGERELFTLVYWLDGKRKREVFPTKEKAVAAAKSANKELGKGVLGAADLTAPQRVACARALDLLAPLATKVRNGTSPSVFLLPRTFLCEGCVLSMGAEIFSIGYPAAWKFIYEKMDVCFFTSIRQASA